MARALAYRCGLRLVDMRTGRTHDYTRRADREEIAHTGLGKFDGMDPSWSIRTTAGAQLLADRVETAEKRVNSTIARDFEGAIPCELSDAQQLAFAQDWSDKLAGRYCTPVPYAVHPPAADGDQRNVHIHALVPDRAVAPSGIEMGPKLRVLGDRVGRGPEEIRELRVMWQNLVNSHLRAAGFDTQIDMGRTRPADQPSVHAGPRRVGRERRRQRNAGIVPDERGVLERAATLTVETTPGMNDGPTPVTHLAANQATGARAPDEVDLEDTATIDMTVPEPARKRRRRMRELVGIPQVDYTPRSIVAPPTPRTREREPSPPPLTAPGVSATVPDITALRVPAPTRKRPIRVRLGAETVNAAVDQVAKIGDAWLIRHAGYELHPEDFAEGDPSSSPIGRALEPDVATFGLEPLAVFEDRSLPDRGRQEHMNLLDDAIDRWRTYWHGHWLKIMDDVRRRIGDLQTGRADDEPARTGPTDPSPATEPKPASYTSGIPKSRMRNTTGRSRAQSRHRGPPRRNDGPEL